jgi:hypothetical protein
MPVLLAAARAQRPVPLTVLPGLAMSLSDCVRTRCVEFVVHTDDLAHSVGLPPPEPDPPAVSVTLDVLIGLCRARAGDAAVIRARARPWRGGSEVLRAL